MSVIGGDILEMSSNNSDLGSFVYKVFRNQDNTLDTGGDSTNDDANAKTGANEAVWQVNGKLGALNITLVNDMSQKTAERLRQEAGSKVDTVYTITVINGISYRGTGRPVGDIIPNVNNSQVTVKIAAPEFKQI